MHEYTHLLIPIHSSKGEMYLGKKGWGGGGVVTKTKKKEMYEFLELQLNFTQLDYII